MRITSKSAWLGCDISEAPTSASARISASRSGRPPASRNFTITLPGS
jgi:hypothetical protein